MYKSGKNKGGVLQSIIFTSLRVLAMSDPKYSLSKHIYLEVATKNILIIAIFLIALLPQISYEFEILKKSQQAGVLSMLGFLMTGGIIGAFELSYAKTNLKSKLQRYLAHTTKFLLYLATAILVWIGYKTMTITDAFYNDWILVAGLLILSALLVFDIWDVVSAVQKQL